MRGACGSSGCFWSRGDLLRDLVGLTWGVGIPQGLRAAPCSPSLPQPCRVSRGLCRHLAVPCPSVPPRRWSWVCLFGVSQPEAYRGVWTWEKKKCQEEREVRFNKARRADRSLPGCKKTGKPSQAAGYLPFPADETARGDRITAPAVPSAVFVHPTDLGGREGGHQAPLQWHRTPTHGRGEPRGEPGRVPCTAPSGPPACLPCCTCRGEARRSRNLVGTGEKIREATAPRNSSAHPSFAAAHAKHTHPGLQRRVPGGRSGSVT